MSENIFREAIHQPSDRVIVALDNMSWHTAETIASEVHEYVGIGKANSIAQMDGWIDAVHRIGRFGLDTMADPKFHDIPETVRLEVEAVTRCGARLITVHASGSQAMLRAAVQGRDEALAHITEEELRNPTGILGITVLTSLDGETCQSIYGDLPEKKVVDFAHLALDAGLDGIVCSGKELRAIRAIPAFDQLVTVVPGISPEWTKKPGDQKRVVTPTEAVQNGADYLVIGRAITQPPEQYTRTEAAQMIVNELKEAV